MIGVAWRWWRIAALATALAGSAPTVLPHAWSAFELWRRWHEPFAVSETKQETVRSVDPAVLIEGHLAGATAEAYRREIESAIQAGDAELAQSLLGLAAQREIPPDPLIEKQVAAIQPDSVAENVWDGVKGEADSPEGFAVELTTDLLVIGDLRDLAKQAWAYPEQDNTIVALAAAGVAASAATAVSGGAAGPAKLGISALKIAKRAGKLNAKLLRSLSALSAKAVDLRALKEVGGRAVRLDWGGAKASAVRIVDRKVVDELLSGGGSLGRLARARGPKAMLDTLATAETTTDLKTLGKLSDHAGPSYRAVLRMSGSKILRPFKRAVRGTKWIRRGSMALDMVTELVGWILSGLLWVLSAAWTALRLLWRVGRFALTAG
ncbi:MAG TPA: hypothetical protein VGN97_19630 [Mesorhizobium sp.]|nr:hypothetical protein [Mesorhizobium sp.]